MDFCTARRFLGLPRQAQAITIMPRIQSPKAMLTRCFDSVAAAARRWIPRRWMLVFACPFLVACGAADSEQGVVIKPTDAAYLLAAVAKKNLTLPTKINKQTEITGVSVIPSGYRYEVRMTHMPADTVDHNRLKTAEVQIAERSCSDEQDRFEMDAGVAMHYVVRGMDSGVAGRFFVSDVYCKSRGW